MLCRGRKIVISRIIRRFVSLSLLTSLFVGIIISTSIGYDPPGATETPDLDVETRNTAQGAIDWAVLGSADYARWMPDNAPGASDYDADFNEESPGPFVLRNSNDSDFNGKWDREENPIEQGETDLIALRVWLDSGQGNYTLRLEETDGDSNIKLWDSREKYNLVSLPKTWDPDGDEVNVVYFIEGYKEDDLHNSRYWLDWKFEEEGQVSDYNYPTVVRIDIIPLGSYDYEPKTHDDLEDDPWLTPSSW